MIAGLAVTIGFAIHDLVCERAVRQSELSLQSQTLALQRGDPPLMMNVPAAGAGTPDRALVHRALYLARLSESLAPGPTRDSVVADAKSSINRALAGRPHWGEAWTVRAYLGTVCRCETPTTTAAALERSYADAPFLKGAAPWRVKLGLEMWPILSPSGRNFITEEGVWSARTDDSARDDLFAAFRDSPAYERFFVRWRELRRDDADTRGTSVPAP